MCDVCCDVCYSVKDRAALYMVAAAEKAGILIPHDKENPGWIVEGTAGNTGIGLTCMANARGYKAVMSVIYIHILSLSLFLSFFLFRI